MDLQPALAPLTGQGGGSFDEYVANLIGIATVPITFDFALTFGNSAYDIGLAELFLDGKDYVNDLTNSLMDKINSWFEEGNLISDNAELAAGLLSALMDGLPAFKNNINSLLDLISKNSDTSNLPYDLLNELLGYFYDNILLTAIGVKRLVDGESIPLGMLKALPLSPDALIDIMLKNGSWIDTFSPSLFDAENSAVDPLIIDLDGDGIETISLKGNVFFDHDGNNLAENTGWVSADDGLLVLDKDNSGYIETGDELFGNNTRDSSGIIAMNGFEALREHDSNNDGIINNQDNIWEDLKVWQDKNSNALVDSGELISLNDIQISSINLNYKTRNITDENNNTHIQHSTVTWVDGSITQASDVWFSQNRDRSLYSGDIEINDNVTNLPFIKGFGILPNLYISMSDDLELMSLVQKYVNNPKLAHSTGVIDKILFQWAKVSNIDINSRGGFIDARQLSFLEKITGEIFKSNATNSSNPHANAASILKQEYYKFSRYFEAMLLAQSKYSQIFSQLDIKFDNQTGFNVDFTRFNSYISNTKDVSLKKSIVLAKILNDCLEYNLKFKTEKEFLDGFLNNVLLGSHDNNNISGKKHQ